MKARADEDLPLRSPPASVSRRAVLATLASLFVFAQTLVVGAPAGAVPTVVDFESFSPGTVLEDQLFGLGVSFPQGLGVFTCSPTGCVSARSGSNAVRGFFAGEFRRDPLEATFPAAQRQISVWVRSDAQFSPPKNVLVTMNAYDASNNPVGSQTKNFSSSAEWTELSVSLGTARIRRVVVSGGQDDLPPTNFLAFDDLLFEGDEPPPSMDTTPPDLTILEPIAGAVRTARNVDLEAIASDDTGLMSVSGAVTGPDGFTTPIDLCGSIFTDICPDPPHTFMQNIDLTGGSNGEYRISLTACDPSDNCTTRSRRFTVDVAEVGTTAIVVSRVEVNQGVQTRLSEVPSPTIGARVNTGVQLIPGKDMSVRWFLFGDGGSVTGFNARLLVTIFNRDGSTVTRTSAPNTGTPLPDLDPEPPSADLLRTLESMRADPTKSLNFVVPGSLLEDARAVQLQIKRGSRILTGLLQGRFVFPLRIGLNVIRMGGSAVATRPPSPTDIDQTIVEYLKRALPVSQVKVLSTRTMLTSTDLILDPLFGCYFVLWQLWAEFGGDETPVRTFTTDPNIITTLGVMGDGALDDAAGCAYVGEADDIDDRRGGTALTTPRGDTAAQEIAHTMGLIHASNSHDEDDGGDADTGWPHPHGTIGDRAFGVVIQLTVPPSRGDLGSATVKVIDPCPTSDPTQRYPTCTLAPDDGGRPHDFMSYGVSTTDLSPLVTLKNRWVSGLTYGRVFAAIGLRSSPIYGDTAAARSAAARSAAAGSRARTEATLVSVVLEENGDATLLPLLSKAISGSMLRGNHGKYRVSLLGAGGETLAEGRFDATSVTTHDHPSSMIRAALPRVLGIQAVRVEDVTSGAILVDEQATATAPVVEITEPTGGEVFAGGQLEVSWEASDADGDPLYHLVQFSPDGGWSWQGMRLALSDDPLTASVDVSELIEGRHGLIRVVTSDGINVTDDVTDVFFSVGTNDEPARSNRVGRRLGVRVMSNGRAIVRLRAPGGPDSCISGATVLLKEGKQTIARRRTNASGGARFATPATAGTYRLVAVQERRAALTCLRTTRSIL